MGVNERTGVPTTSGERAARAAEFDRLRQRVADWWDACLFRGSQLPFQERTYATMQSAEGPTLSRYMFTHHWDFQRVEKAIGLEIEWRHGGWRLLQNAWCRYIRVEAFYRSYLWWEFGAEWNLRTNQVTMVQFAMAANQVINPLRKVSRRRASVYRNDMSIERQNKRSFYHFNRLESYRDQRADYLRAS